MWDTPDTGGTGNSGTGGTPSGSGDAFMAAAAIADIIVSSETARKNREAAKGLAEYGYSKDLEMWHLMNKYNSPQEQMRRLKEAGLNPRLIYGSSGNTGQATQLPRYQAPRPEYTHKIAQVAPLMAMYQSFQKNQAQIDNVKTQTQLNAVKTMTESSRAMSGKARAQMDSELAKYSQNMARYQYLKVARDAENELARGSLMHAQEVSTRQKTDTEKYSTRIRREEAKLAEKYGLKLGDAWQLRVATRIAEMMGFPIGDMLGGSPSYKWSWNIPKNK